MPQYLINQTRGEYLHLLFGISHLYYLRQVQNIWDIHNDDMYYECLSEPPAMKNIGNLIERYT